MKKKIKFNLQENPLLVTVNPCDMGHKKPKRKATKDNEPYKIFSSEPLLDMKKFDKEMLWIKCKQLKPEVTRFEFEKAIDQYHRQHHGLPDSVTLEHVPGIDESKIKIMVKMGDVEEILYKPSLSSRKALNEGKKELVKYIHKTKSEGLATDSDGKALAYYGKTKVNPKGWLID